MMLQIHWTFTGCDMDDELAVQHLWEDRRLPLEAKLATLPVEPSELRLGVHQDSDTSDWEVQAALHLPARTLVAESGAEDVQPALDDVIGTLVGEIEAYETLRDDVSHSRDGIEPVTQLLEHNYAAGRSEAFLAFLRPILRSLAPHVRRELQVFEMEGTLDLEEITSADILDEVMIRAWDRFGRRPPSLKLDVWLIQLTDEVLNEAVQQPHLVSLDEREQISGPDPVDPSSPSAWVEEISFMETLELGELLPDAPGTDEWDRLDMEIKELSFARLLAQIPREQRQALIFSAIEGFDPAEIAAIQQRSEEEVQQDIALAQRKLTDYFTQQDITDLEQEFEQPGGRDRRRRRR